MAVRNAPNVGPIPIFPDLIYDSWRRKNIVSALNDQDSLPSNQGPQGREIQTGNVDILVLERDADRSAKIQLAHGQLDVWNGGQQYRERELRIITNREPREPRPQRNTPETHGRTSLTEEPDRQRTGIHYRLACGLHHVLEVMRNEIFDRTIP